MSDLSDADILQQARCVRVFVSSTFRDMQEEREILVKKTFPELRKRCRERQVEFVEVDLRWGITEEQSQRGEVLPICLAEIERCRPFFIGLLGEKYGWVPDTIGPELVKAQPWLAEHKERSVTELEVLHGVLRDPLMADRSYFYFRDPAYLEQIPDDRRADFQSENRQAADKLERLKQRIRESKVPLKENYPGPETLGRLILEDLWQAIDKQFPAEAIPDPLDREAAEHETFARSRAKVYIGREQDDERLDGYVNSGGPPLVLVGESGVGKSALVANWAERYRKAHPEAFMILHFVGSSPGSADFAGIIRRIMGEIKRRDDLPEEVPATPDKLREALPLWLASASANGLLVLILDGLNQLEDRDNALHLGWLPTFIPANVRLIVSSLPGPSLNALGERKWTQLEVHGLDPEARGAIIARYLEIYRKELNPRQLERVASAVQTSNPLFLRALLEELRLFGVYEQLDDRIDHYLAAETVPALYERILARMEEDYEKDRPNLVADATSLIWASRRGLYESELLELLGDSNQSIPQAVWSPLYLAMEESLVSHTGLLSFFHDYLRRAVENRYVSAPETQKTRHVRLADYFTKKDLDERKADELPWQLTRAEEWEKLKDSISEPTMFNLLVTDAKRYELVGYWLKLGQRFDMVQSYQSAIDAYEMAGTNRNELAGTLNNVAFFLDLNARFDGAELMYRRALEILEQLLGPLHPSIATGLSNLAELLSAKGDRAGAGPLHRKALEIREKALGAYHADTAQSLNNLAVLLQAKGDYSGAKPLYKRALDIWEQVFGPQHPETARSLNNLAEMLRAKAEYAEAEPLYRRGLEIREKALGAHHPDMAQSLNNLALLLYTKGDYTEAEPLYRRALEIWKQILGPRHPETARCLNNLAVLLQAKADHAGAEPLYRKALEIREQVLGQRHPETAESLNNLAFLLYTKGDYAGAEPLYRKALGIREQVLGPQHLETARSMNNFAALLYAKGDYTTAEPLYRRALEIREQVLGPQHPETAQSLSNLAALLNAKGCQAEAEPLLRRALQIREQIFGAQHPDTAQNLNSLAELLYAMGRQAETEPLLRRALEIREKMLGAHHADTAHSLSNLGVLLCAKGDYARAEPLLRRALEIRKDVLGTNHPGTAVTRNSLTALLQAKGDYEESQPLLRGVDTCAKELVSLAGRLAVLLPKLSEADEKTLRAGVALATRFNSLQELLDTRVASWHVYTPEGASNILESGKMIAQRVAGESYSRLSMLFGYSDADLFDILEWAHKDVHDSVSL